MPGEPHRRRLIRSIAGIAWHPPGMQLESLIGEAVLSTRSDAIVATDRDGIVRLWNPGAERIFGYTAQEAIGRSLDLIIPERLRERHWAGFRKTVETGESRYGEGDLLS